ncbi:glycosyltransferase family 32 protein [Mixia osmundae IAM 14324]|uniref:Glycosyltransferase family 32 protein n=1 Tax=Mixia osmundae (strain CBS 9802 / IAM 14324 / JCM 22182 / KY 12970) TaxID=764103 RepID=G7DZT8_MIXOS|nr:glycosyltransferase family 32 protein [Mixia osmundae IAM 14324]KEI39242.1 glycosyltransferase family 32 protein [Mixia osmundae IAM 14324]GAA96098.1 hypothetical protein E5Q_02759 [Mixia osmundae IAM 14324]
MARKASTILLTLLGLFLLGTVIVLSTVKVYFGVDSRDVITIEEINLYASLDTKLYNSTLRLNDGDGDDLYEKVPRIIHQTWKTDILPERWQAVRDECAAMHPDYEYRLWSDEASREFIQERYAWFLPVFDGYQYPIQRADAIRYFVLDHFGGIYMDLDVGCKRRLDPLLNFDVVLARTIPVGVSNDVMVAAPHHPFMEMVTRNLVTFDHSYGSNYPTVMFSTGPMFLSAQYGLWPANPITGAREIRILPKSLYGKNAKPEEALHAFFTHYYGSSWHDGDSGFILFLGKRGKLLMRLGMIILALGVARLAYKKRDAIQGLWQRKTASLLSSPELDGDRMPLPAIALSRRTSARSSDELMQSPAKRKVDSLGAAGTSGRLYYLPVWLAGERQPGVSTESGVSWLSYLPDRLASLLPGSSLYEPLQAHESEDNAISLKSLRRVRSGRPRSHTQRDAMEQGASATGTFRSAGPPAPRSESHSDSTSTNAEKDDGPTGQSSTSIGLVRTHSRPRSRRASYGSRRHQELQHSFNLADEDDFIPREDSQRQHSPGYRTRERHDPPAYSSTPEPRFERIASWRRASLILPIVLVPASASEGSAISTSPELEASDPDADSLATDSTTDSVTDEVDRLLSEMAPPVTSRNVESQ